MKRILSIVVITVGVFLAGCATPTPKSWTPTGGSKSDGMVTLGFSYGSFEKPVITIEDGVPLAVQRCKQWGYTNATPFGSTRSECTASNQYGCLRANIYADYQCTE